MYVKKNFSVGELMSFTGGHLVWLTTWAALVTATSVFTEWEWMNIPWLPLSLIGTAVAFYVGFKNNSAYDRQWEARKIWGAIVNNSRMWGAGVRSYVSNLHADDPAAQEELDKIHTRLIYRHIAWLYTLRSQLLVPTPWEHINASRLVARVNEKRRKHYGVHMNADPTTVDEINKYLPDDEVDRLLGYKNTATQIIDQQSKDLQELREKGLIDDFRHMDLQKLLNDCYTHQGKCERIKKFPLPRQYGSASFVFVSIFIFLLPLGMVSACNAIEDVSTWMAIPFTVIAGWVFLMMELIGDYSENPFEGLGNDIPMLSLCRVIEIDLLQMLGEEDLPPPIEAKNNVLM